MCSLILCLVATFVVVSVRAINFPYESIQLTPSDVKNYSQIAFGSLVGPRSSPPTFEGCKIFPGDKQWPSDTEWAKFNSTLGGALLPGIPPAIACYNGTYDAAKCDRVKAGYFNDMITTSDPVSIENEWLTGDSCPAHVYTNAPGVNSTTPTCDVGAYPAYVVNATTVKHIQLAVNFARNTGVRLIIRNTGHSQTGQSTGAGSLSIWIHNLNEFEYLPSYSIGTYNGQAARLSAGLQNFQVQAYARSVNVTIVTPGGPTVGVVGGWFLGGGHGLYTSYYGLGADQVLSIEVVTADGNFVTASPNTNSDLFWALRGGGGSSYGVVSSVIMKAYELTPIGFPGTVIFQTTQRKGVPFVPKEKFWDAIRAYHQFVPQICDAGGIGFTYIYHIGNGTDLQFTVGFSMPGMNFTQANTFVEPFLKSLAAVGVTNAVVKSRADQPGPSLVNDSPIPYPSRGAGAMNFRLASRLFPRDSFEDDGLLNATTDAIKSLVVDGGYTFHGNNHCPSLEVAGFPDNAVLPAYRRAAMHAQAWERTYAIGPIEVQKKENERFQTYMQKWRDVSPGAGSYMNEADPGEPDWQWAYYGENYERLLSIKKKWDPWGVFWGKTAVGSEGWEVRTPVVGWPAQNVSNAGLGAVR